MAGFDHIPDRPDAFRLSSWAFAESESAREAIAIGRRSPVSVPTMPTGPSMSLAEQDFRTLRALVPRSESQPVHLR
jgi:hypothetical protein